MGLSCVGFALWEENCVEARGWGLGCCRGEAPAGLLD